MASPTRHAPQPGFAFEHRRIPVELVQRRGPFTFTVPPLTAIELATLDDSDPIDVALRRKAADLGSLRDALQQTRRRRGNTSVAVLLTLGRALVEGRATDHRLYRALGSSAGWGI